MVEAKKIKLVMSARELAVGLKKGGIARNGLVQQVDCLQQIRFQRTTQTQHKKIIGSIVEIKGYEISRGRLFNGQFLRSRNFRAKAPSDRSGKLTLERKQVVQIAIVFLCPDEITCASVYQSSLEVKTRAPATVGHGTLQNVRNPKRFTNLANIPLPAILHYAGMADHPEIVDAGEFGQNVVLNTIGKNGVLFIVAQTFEGQNSNAGCRRGACRATLPHHRPCHQSQCHQKHCDSRNS